MGKGRGKGHGQGGGCFPSQPDPAGDIPLAETDNDDQQQQQQQQQQQPAQSAQQAEPQQQHDTAAYTAPAPTPNPAYTAPVTQPVTQPDPQPGTQPGTQEGGHEQLTGQPVKQPADQPVKQPADQPGTQSDVELAYPAPTPGSAASQPGNYPAPRRHSATVTEPVAGESALTIFGRTARSAGGERDFGALLKAIKTDLENERPTRAIASSADGAYTLVVTEGSVIGLSSRAGRKERGRFENGQPHARFDVHVVRAVAPTLEEVSRDRRHELALFTKVNKQWKQTTYEVVKPVLRSQIVSLRLPTSLGPAQLIYRISDKQQGEQRLVELNLQFGTNAELTLQEFTKTTLASALLRVSCSSVHPGGTVEVTWRRPEDLASVGSGDCVHLARNGSPAGEYLESKSMDKDSGELRFVLDVGLAVGAYEFRYVSYATGEVWGVYPLSVQWPNKPVDDDGSVFEGTPPPLVYPGVLQQVADAQKMARNTTELAAYNAYSSTLEPYVRAYTVEHGAPKARRLFGFLYEKPKAVAENVIMPAVNPQPPIDPVWVPTLQMAVKMFDQMSTPQVFAAFGPSLAAPAEEYSVAYGAPAARRAFGLFFTGELPPGTDEEIRKERGATDQPEEATDGTGGPGEAAAALDQAEKARNNNPVEKSAQFPISRLPGVWANVRVFISSTFVDTHGERDLLIQKVFPRLNKHFKSRFIRVTPVDLRWGVSDAETAKIQLTCLNELDNCRGGADDMPWFIGLRGERYGWVQDKYEAAEQFDRPELYGWLSKVKKPVSITTLEVYQAFLRGLHRDQNTALHNIHAFCYFRDPGFKQAVPAELRWIFDFDYRPEGHVGSDNVQYQLTAKADTYAHDLQEVNAEIRAATSLCKSVDFKCGFETAKITGSRPSDGKKFGCGWTDDLGALEAAVFEDLKHAIELEYLPVPTITSQEEQEAIDHRVFAERKAEFFVGRTAALRKLTDFLDGGADEASPPLVVVGDPGAGKSALIAKLAASYVQTHSRSTGTLVLTHLVGATASSTHVRGLLARFCGELRAVTPGERELPNNVSALKSLFHRQVKSTASQMKLVIIIDAVNQLSAYDFAHDMNWLPPPCKNVRVLLSSLVHPCVDALLARPSPATMFVLEPLQLDERKEIVRAYLGRYHKSLNEDATNGFLGDQMGMLLDKAESGNVLYLTIACEALREFGVYEELSGYLSDLLPGTVPGLFRHYLTRLEEQHGRGLIESVLALIFLARGGLLENEVEALLALQASLSAHVTSASDVSSFATVYNSLAYFLAASGGAGLLQLFHQQLQFLVRDRYLVEPLQLESKHRLLGLYFRRCIVNAEANLDRALQHAPYHLTEARDWQSVGAMLCDLEFIEICCSLKLSLPLFHQYQHTLAALAVELRAEPGTEGTGGETDPLPDDHNDELTKEARTLARILPSFSRFFSANMHFFGSQPELVLPYAINAAVGPVSEAADRLVARMGGDCAGTRPVLGGAGTGTRPAGEEEGGPMVFLKQGWRAPVENPCMFVIPFKDLEITCMAMSPDAVFFATGEKGGNIGLWVLETGSLVAQFDSSTELLSKRGINRKVTCVAFSEAPGHGSVVAFGRDDGTVGLCDINAGIEICKARALEERIALVSIVHNKDGSQRVLFSACRTNGGPVRVGCLDCTTGNVALDAGGLTSAASAPSFLSSSSRYEGGIRALLQTYDKSFFIDFEVSKLGGLKAREGGGLTWDSGIPTLRQCTMSRDQQRMAGSCDLHDANAVYVLQIIEGKVSVEHIFYGHSSKISHIFFSYDGNMLLTSGVADHSILVWSLVSGCKLSHMTPHQGPITCCFAQQNRLASLSIDDRTIRVFDITSQRARLEHAGSKGRQQHLNNTWEERDREFDNMLLSPDGQVVLIVSDQGYLSVWDRNQSGRPKLLCEMETKLQAVGGLNCRHRIVADGSWKRLYIAQPSRIRVFDLAALVQAAQSAGKVADLSSFLVCDMEGHHRCDISSLALARSGDRMVSGAADHMVNIWDTDKMTLVATLKEHEKRVWAVGIAPDGTWAVSGDDAGVCVVWDLVTQTKSHSFTLWEDLKPTCMAVSPNMDMFVVGSNKRASNDISAFNRKGELLGSFDGLNDMAQSLMFSGDGRYLVASSQWQGGSCIWDASELELVGDLHLLEQLTTAAISSDGSTMAVSNRTVALFLSVEELRAQNEGQRWAAIPQFQSSVVWVDVHAEAGLVLAIDRLTTVVKVYSFGECGLPKIKWILLEGHGSNSIIGAMFSKDGQTAYSWSQHEWTTWDLNTGKMRSRKSTDDHRYIGLARNIMMGFSRDREYVVAAANYQWQVIETSTGEIERAEGNLSEASMCVAISHDATMIASVGHSGKLTLFHLPRNDKYEEVCVIGCGASLAFSTDGRLAVGNTAGELHIMDTSHYFVPDKEKKTAYLPAGQLILPDGWAPTPVKKLLWTPDNALLVSLSEDAVRLWSGDTLQPVTVRPLGGKGTCMALMGDTIVVGDADGRVSVLHIRSLLDG